MRERRQVLGHVAELPDQLSLASLKSPLRRVAGPA
jgi:hypothetical protein